MSRAKAESRAGRESGALLTDCHSGMCFAGSAALLLGAEGFVQVLLIEKKEKRRKKKVKIY